MKPLYLLSTALTTLALTHSALADSSASATSNNREIVAVPTPAPVTIDGKENDWDLSAGIWSYNDPTLVDKYSVWSHVMWDDKGVYLLMRYTDDTPLKNATRGEDFHQSWQADAFQGRVIFDHNTDEEHQMHINGFHSSSEQRNYMIVNHGGFKKNPPYDATGPYRQDLEDEYGITMDDFGGQIAFKEWENGQGYNLEAFWPWEYVRLSGEPLNAGDRFVLGIEAMWGDPEGIKVDHRLVDNLRNDAVNRIFFFRAKEGWGEVVLSNEGNLAITEAQQNLQAERLKQFTNFDTAGSMEIAYELPSDREVTIAIDNADGQRVRNLFGQYPRSAGKNIDYWDGLDDSSNPVPPGEYTATIVDHEPFSLKFLNSVYNSSTPPWSTSKGWVNWGSNHGHPTSAASRGDVLLIGFTGTEGTSGVQRIDEKGIIQWVNVTESLDLTMDDDSVYLFSREAWTERAMVRKLDINTGKITLFEDEKRSTESVIPLANWRDAPNSSTIAYAYGQLYVCIPTQGLWIMRPSDGKILEHQAPSELVAVDNHKDELYGLFKDGSIRKLDTKAQTTKTLIQTKGVLEPVRFALSSDGNRIAISDSGTNQVLVYNRKGTQLHALGDAYQKEHDMRPAGPFIETNFVDPLGLDFDSQGRLWIAEANHSCRRVTSWSTAGTLLNQYWGSTDYGAVFGFPFVDDSTKFIALGIEFKLDPNPDVFNRPTQEQPLYFHPDLAHNERGLVYELNGHEYAVVISKIKTDYLTIAKRDESGVFTTVVQVDYDDPRTKNIDESRVWIDRNDNGIEDANEIIEGGIDIKHHYWNNAWIQPDLTILTANQKIFRPTGFTETGVPLYDFTDPEEPKNPITGIYSGDNIQIRKNGSIGTFVMDSAGNLSDGVHYSTADGRQGAYPNPYKRHDAPAAQRGLLIAPFRTVGVVEDVPGVGSITALAGDRGEWFLMSMDGLYLSSLLQDIKGEISMDPTFVGPEAFGGFLWRDEKGRVLVQIGRIAFRIMELHGLETVRKQSIQLSATTESIAKGIEIATANKEEAYQEPEQLTIAKVNTLSRVVPSPSTSIDNTILAGASTARIQEAGNPSNWFRVAMAQDGKNLAIAYQVNDSSPWKNSEGRFSHGFIGGDAVDLKLEVPGRGEVRILAAPLASGETVTYWQKHAEAPDNPTTYVVSTNTANARQFDIVRRLDKARIQSRVGNGKYSVLVTIPLDEIGLNPSELSEVKGIPGIIYSNSSGTNRTSRLYWHDKDTGMVSDVPTEAGLDAKRWGTILIEQ
ncbi:FlgD immunoglobulin-like domain containing protein [Coraliomargarita parva]|uniref:FlgD immunoglobulin-like domain containing protein n=1 Tax=Coraliomargarita parva TaxID=3014050 RepID=UPI0022B33076|nr:FlgD immunoglobulin-like domain containing protein [Coraliomargarita parva]